MIERLAWAALALIHALPALALFNPALISRLYGVAPGDGAFLLLHHRAALFLCVVILCVWAAVDPGVRRAASVVVAVSMLSFLILWQGAGRPPALRSIAIADLVGLLPLALATWRSWSA
ncbi:MAG: hypothetical protein KGQ52_04825 [Alphaproteobacteria bacterium]|nr:hypothetical protein [Alphaproteobacteria bacterium]